MSGQIHWDCLQLVEDFQIGSHTYFLNFRIGIACCQAVAKFCKDYNLTRYLLGGTVFLL